VVFVARHSAIVVLPLSTAVTWVVVAETTAVQEDNAVRNTAIVAPPQNTVAAAAAAAVMSSIPAMADAVARVVQRDHVVPHMDFVETLLPIAEEPVMATEEPVMATVVALVVALVSAAHNTDIVAPMLPIVLSPNSSPESSQLRSKVNSKDKRHITMRPSPVRTTAHVVQVELVL